MYSVYMINKLHVCLDTSPSSAMQRTLDEDIRTVKVEEEISPAVISTATTHTNPYFNYPYFNPYFDHYYNDQQKNGSQNLDTW